MVVPGLESGQWKLLQSKQQLIWVTGSFSLADCHAHIMPQAGMLKRPCEYSN